MKREYILKAEDGESILDALKREDVSIGAVCGGNGSCGKCKIRVINGRSEITEQDRRHFSVNELEAGMRLACFAHPAEEVRIEILFESGEEFSVVTGKSRESGKAAAENAYGIAVDIGTTTIAMHLVGLESGRIIKTYTALNSQRRYGADVISRIKAALEGAGEELRSLIRRDLSYGIRQLAGSARIDRKAVSRVSVAGNTTMIHLLMGYDCSGLGACPFTPVTLEMIEGDYKSMLGDDFLDADVCVLPGISAFVGGDIVSGLYEIDMDRRDGTVLLIDLGTNGEIALGSCGRILAASTAAGPAFEGGNIRCGTGSVAGAISGVSINGDGVRIKTIGKRQPVGICGTGVIEAVAELAGRGIIDETGRLCGRYFAGGYPLAKAADGADILLDQKDIRQVQLAKAAVRAGIETLLLRCHVRKEDVSGVYLAGGFGLYLDSEKAARIGMLPKELAHKMRAVGNSSLDGAVKCLLCRDGKERLRKIAESAREINLSADPDFNRFYVEYMYFE